MCGPVVFQASEHVGVSAVRRFCTEPDFHSLGAVVGEKENSNLGLVKDTSTPHPSLHVLTVVLESICIKM